MKNFCFLVLGILMLGCESSKLEESTISPEGELISTDTSESIISTELGIVNTKLPEIFGKNHNEEPVDIRKIKAKYILLEFWASWCPPCRKSNPGLVSVYEKYKREGFEIFSISLDDKHSKWVDAINHDNLSWPYHICEYKGWESKWARVYKIEEIPNNVLLDQKGNILAQSMEPKDLEQVLAKLLVKK